MLIHELRTALHRLWSRPTYTIICVSVLGLGLGSVMFLLSLVNGLLLQPLPFPSAERLVGIGYEREGNVGIGIMSSNDFSLLKKELRSYELVGGYSETNVQIGQGAGTKRYAGTLLTQDMLPILGVKPLLGRAFEADDNHPGAPLTVILSERTWRNDFGGTPGVIGRKLRVNAEMATVIGVFPDGFSFPNDSEVWLPRRLAADEDTDMDVVGRLREAASIEQAQGELVRVAGALGAQLDGQRAERKLVLKALPYKFVNEKTRVYVWLMFAASTMVLLLACVNCANLQLAQALKRRRELAIYSALGAGSAVLVRQQLAECLVLSFAGTAVSIGAAHLGGAWILSLFAENDQAAPYFIHLGIDLRLLGFSFVAALVATALAGLLPALLVARTNPQEALREGDKGSAGGGFIRIAHGLVIAEIVLTVVLLVGAGTFILGLQRLQQTSNGTTVSPDKVLTARLNLFEGELGGSAQQIQFFERLVARLKADPNVESASVSNTLPGAVLGSHEYIGAVGAPVGPGGYAKAQVGFVDDHFASTYGLRLQSGRFLDANDRPDGKKVAVVNARLARLLWPDRDPLGQRLFLNPQREHPLEVTVVGVVEELQLEGALEPRLPAMVLPISQFPVSAVHIAVHIRTDPVLFAPLIAAAVAAENPDTAVYHVVTLARLMAARRLSLVVLTQIFTGVGVLALLLAVSGLYGLLTFSVAQRTREIGIRRAIGASDLQIAGAVGTRLLRQLALGLAIGCGVALPWSGLLANPSMQTQGYDPKVFGIVIGAMLAAAALSFAVPLWRVLRIDPIIALRQE